MVIRNLIEADLLMTITVRNLLKRIGHFTSLQGWISWAPLFQTLALTLLNFTGCFTWVYSKQYWSILDWVVQELWPSKLVVHENLYSISTISSYFTVTHFNVFTFIRQIREYSQGFSTCVALIRLNILY